MPNIKQNLDSITVVGFPIYDERSVRQLEQDQKVPLNYIGKVGVGIPVHNGGHVWVSVWATLPATECS